MSNPEIDRFLEDVLRRRSATELGALIDYDLFSRHAEGQSPRTIQGTGLALRKLKAYLENKGLPTDARFVAPRDIRAFILDLKQAKRLADHPYARAQEEPLSGHTISCYLRAIRSSWNRWFQEGLLETTPFSKVKVPKAPTKVIPTFSEDQLGALFAAINTSTAEGFRDYTMIATYLDTACRCTELTKAMVDDVDLKGRWLRVLGKGQRERVVPFGVTVQKLLWRYLHFHRPEPCIPRNDRVFLTRDGRPVTKNRVEAIMQKYGRRAGIRGVRCSPHTLRHTACVLYLRNGGDLFSLQRITGHTSPEVLRGYVNLAQSDVSAIHRRNSPTDNLGFRVPRARGSVRRN